MRFWRRKKADTDLTEALTALSAALKAQNVVITQHSQATSQSAMEALVELIDGRR